MPLNPQTAGIPPIYFPDRSWSLELRSLASFLAPGSGMIQGLKFGVPLSSNAPTTGLTPTLTDGVLIQGDQVFGITGSKVISAAAKNVANRKMFFGLKGFYYADADNLAKAAQDMLLGEITTDNQSTASIITLAQPLNYGGGRFGIRAVLNQALLTDGADVDLFSWVLPSVFDNVRLEYAQARVLSGTTAGNDTGDDLLIKIKPGAASAVTLLTLAAANAATANFVQRQTPDDADAFSWNLPGGTFKLQYNQTDTATAIAGGYVEVIVILEGF